MAATPGEPLPASFARLTGGLRCSMRSGEHLAAGSPPPLESSCNARFMASPHRFCSPLLSHSVSDNFLSANLKILETLVTLEKGAPLKKKNSREIS
jgi:hypothetical protein